jgi:hypothetical protein
MSVTRWLIVAFLILAGFASPSHAQTNAAANFQNCLGGYAATCNASLLTLEQREAVERAAVARNYENCLGGYSALCRESVLTPEQRQRVTESKLARNYQNCLGGYDALCNESLLAGEQQPRVAQARLARNFQNCIGGYALLCKQSLLTPELQDQVRRSDLSRNYQNCLGGYATLCRETLLSTDERVRVEQSAVARNYQNCLGGYRTLCRESLLSVEQHLEVAQADSVRSQRQCAAGYTSACRAPSLTHGTAATGLTVDQRAELAAQRAHSATSAAARPALSGVVASQGNYEACLQNLAALCKLESLTVDERAEVAAARSRVTTTEPTRGPPCAENGSCYGDISDATGRPKTVHVDGYYRRDGTYVRGHYRSSPRR